MTARPLQDVAIEPLLDDAVDGSGVSVSRSSWPRVRLVSAACTIAVTLALAAPLIIAGPDLRLLPLSVVILLLAAFVVRWSFDSRALITDGRVGMRTIGATIPAAALGVAVVTAAHAVLGVSIDPWAVLASFPLTVGGVSCAAAARAVEVRVRCASRMVFLVGTEEQRRDLQRQVRRHGDMRLVGFVRAGDVPASGRGTSHLAAAISDAGTTSLVLSAEAIRNDSICAAASQCNLQGRKIRTLESFYEEQFKRIPLSDLTPSWFLFDIAEIHKHWMYRSTRRAAETLLAASLLVLAAPLLAAIALAVRLSGPGTVLFRQQRVGLADEPFTMLKFRTMRPADNLAEATWAPAAEARITAVGRLLRRARLDELPQLWNVLRGQLSLIGPRPEQIAIVRHLEQQIPFYAARHVVRPGLTGWAQVNCGYGGSLEGTLEKLQFDLFYVKHQSLRLDLMILASTLRAIVAANDT